MAAEITRVARTKVGRPRKHGEGWSSVNKRICISIETFTKWRRLRDDLKLVNDDVLACHLLSTVVECPIERPGPESSMECPTESLLSLPVLSSTPILLDRQNSTQPACDKRACTLHKERKASYINEQFGGSDDETISIYREYRQREESYAVEQFGDSGDDTISICHEDRQRLMDVTSILCGESSEYETSDSDESDTEESSESDIETGQTAAEAGPSNPSTGEGSQWVICSINKLVELASRKCQAINCRYACQVSYEVTGCCLQLSGVCQDGHRFYWSSSEFHTNKNRTKIFDVNLLLASAIVLSGNNFTKIKMLSNFMHLAVISKTTFYSYQRGFICPTVNAFYKQEQSKLIEKYKNKDLVMCGDGRCDSPGKSAKFCTYSLMESENNEILHFENIDKREVDLRSPNMEREGMIRSLDFLIEKQLRVVELITDSSSSIAKTLETKYPDVYHSRDVWHKAKKLKKALAEAGKVRNMGKINQWSQQIVNHFWFCCRTCEGSSVKLKEKWISVLHHVLNEHEWLLGQCEHQTLTGPPTDGNGVEISYFNQQELAFRMLRKIVTDKNWLQSLNAYTKFRHTGMLESYHSLILGYCPKRTAYQNESYLARVQLAVLDHNAHVKRAAATNSSGEQIYHRKYRRQSKKWDVTPVKENKHYKYIPQLIAAIFTQRMTSADTLKQTIHLPNHHPANIQSTIAHTRPGDTADIVKTKRSRFSDQ